MGKPDGDSHDRLIEVKEGDSTRLHSSLLRFRWMLFGYNTNGFAHHRLEDALTILAEIGYGSAAITLDYHALNPFEPDLPQRAAAVRRLLRKLSLRSVVETGARFLLDPRRKHQPTLLSPEVEAREARLAFLRHAVAIAQELGSDAVSFWSGTPTDDAPPTVLMSRLAEGCKQLADFAAGRQVRLAFEPEPGMFIDRMTRFEELRDRVAHPFFGLTLDIGHVHCQGEGPIADQIRRWRAVLWNVHIEDMRRGVHEHLMFGAGEIDFAPVLRTLEETGYGGGVHVELGRHSADAVETARRALAFLRGICPGSGRDGL
jgi:sugar phosphate isomerase/epimerase